MLRIRTGIDGTFWIAKHDTDTEAYLDGQYERLPNQLKWKNKIPNLINNFSNIYKDSLCYLIGKGPSLDYISPKVFTDTSAPIICINESIHVIEKLNLPNDLYVTQLDHELVEACKPSKITTKMFFGPMCANLYQQGVIKFLIDPLQLGLYNCISAEYAIMIARHMGCNRLELVSFDSCVNKNLNYAATIGYDSIKGGPKTRFLEHKERILQVAKNTPLTWVTPGENEIAYTASAT